MGTIEGKAYKYTAHVEDSQGVHDILHIAYVLPHDEQDDDVISQGYYRSVLATRNYDGKFEYWLPGAWADVPAEGPGDDFEEISHEEYNKLLDGLLAELREKLCIK